MGHWNYRILAHENKGETWFAVHRVYYNDKSMPDGYTESPATLGGGKINDIRWEVTVMRDCLNHSVLWAGKRFPEKYVK